LAAANGRPPGVKLVRREAGIKESDWSGKYWARWSQALREAGFAPNRWTAGHDETAMVRRFALLIREMGRVPTGPELRLKRHDDPTIAGLKAYQEHFGNKAALLARVRAYCKGRRGFRAVVALCNARAVTPIEVAAAPPDDSDGFVYLLRSGRFYKIGRTNNIGRRTRELRLLLPHKALRVHVIKTDDPAGVERYWHRRFADKRKNGEFFTLNAADVLAFKRWRRI
jgi:hypothetical protein